MTFDGRERRKDPLGFKPGNDFMGVPFLYHHKDKVLVQMQRIHYKVLVSVSGIKNGILST